MKHTLRLLVKVLISPRSLMEEVQRRRSLSILLVCPISAVLIMICARTNNLSELSTSVGIGSILILSILFGGCLLAVAGVVYILSRLCRRGANITYLSFVSGIAFTIVPFIGRDLLMTLVPSLSKLTAAGTKYFILSVGAFLKPELEFNSPLLFRIAAFQLEPFALWGFLLRVYLISIFFQIRVWKAIGIVLILSIPSALLPLFRL